MKSDERNYQAGLSMVNQTMKYDGQQRIQLLSQIVDQLVADYPKTTVIRVCGTNGKGSTITMIDNVLQRAGYRTGRFTSPYLLDPLEQIKLNGTNLTHVQFLAAEQIVERTVEQLGYRFQTDISEFESWFLIAVQAFLNANVDIMLLECGMGGEFDATNAIDHSDMSIFTLIGLDHFKFLGDTLAQIATTKVKMIRDDETVINYGNQRTQVADILKAEVADHNAHLHVANDISIMNARFDAHHLRTICDVSIDGRPVEFSLQLLGDFQIENLKMVVEWWRAFNASHERPISVNELVAGVAETKIIGRFSPLQNGLILDGAHNRDAINAFVNTVNHYFASSEKVIIVGFLADKEVTTCVHELQKLTNATFITVTPDNHERALPASKLTALFEQEPRIKTHINRVLSASNITDAFSILKAHPDAHKLVVGSFYTVKAVMEK
ncbi:bifunctional folylpolyglutamate synthase/dihydrofolate synthase [Lactobacillaceae bacterium Melli_B4]